MLIFFLDFILAIFVLVFVLSFNNITWIVLFSIFSPYNTKYNNVPALNFICEKEEKDYSFSLKLLRENKNLKKEHEEYKASFLKLKEICLYTGVYLEKNGFFNEYKEDFTNNLLDVIENKKNFKSRYFSLKNLKTEK